jgi:hypothetical protein
MSRIEQMWLRFQENSAKSVGCPENTYQELAQSDRTTQEVHAVRASSRLLWVLVHEAVEKVRACGVRDWRWP